jgi:Flp pilus assembly protein TadD/ribosomal protein L40E
MSEAKFCMQCGARLVGDARFCVECGAPATGAKRPQAVAVSWSRYAPVLIVGVVVLVVCGAIVVARLNPKTPPSVPGRGASAAPGAAGQMPPGHPPIAIPDDVKQTIRDMAKKAQAEPDNMQVWKQLAEVQYRAGQVEASYLAEAQLSFEHVLEHEADNADVLRSLGNIAFDREQPDQAIDFYTRYLKLKPDDRNVQTDLATMQLAAGKADEAIAAYEKILAADPTFVQAQFNIGLAYHTAGKTPEAVAALKKARELASDDRSRQQVDRVLARLQGGESAPAPVADAAPPNVPEPGGATGEAGTLQAGVEGFFRTHPIMGPKVDRFEWKGADTVRVVLNDFPMTAMPEFVRQQLEDRIRSQIKEQKAAHKVTQTVQVEIVDDASGQVMDTITD